MRNTCMLTAFGLLATQACNAGWLYNLHPKDIRAHLGGGLTFATTEALVNPAGCSSAEFYGIAIDVNGHHRNTLAILLTALTTDRLVSVYVVENSCFSAGRPLVTDVLLQ